MLHGMANEVTTEALHALLDNAILLHPVLAQSISMFPALDEYDAIKDVIDAWAKRRGLDVHAATSLQIQALRYQFSDLFVVATLHVPRSLWAVAS
jgi:hypothetical protein